MRYFIVIAQHTAGSPMDESQKWTNLKRQEIADLLAAQRLFAHLTRVCEGVIFETVEVVKNLMEKAKTKTGLKVFRGFLYKPSKRGNKHIYILWLASCSNRF